MSSNPYSDENYPSPYEFQSQSKATYSGSDGYVKQVPVLGVLHIVQAVFELPMCIILFALSWFLIAAQNSPQLQQEMQQQMQGGISMQVIAIGYGIFGAAIGLIACMRLTAGVLLLTNRGRVFAIVISVMGLLSVFTCYCAPTSLGLSIYSLVVLIQPSVMEAFKRTKATVNV